MISGAADRAIERTVIPQHFADRYNRPPARRIAFNRLAIGRCTAFASGAVHLLPPKQRVGDRWRGRRLTFATARLLGVRMTGRRLICAGLLLAAAAVASVPSAVAIETTYGEDPVPNSQCTDDFIDLGYGIDPIPAKSPSQRWNEWRISRGKPPAVGVFRRQVGQPRVEQSQVTPLEISPQKNMEPRRVTTGTSTRSGTQSGAVRQPAETRPSSRRAYQPKSTPRAF